MRVNQPGRISPDTLQGVCLAYIAVWCLSPPMSYDEDYRLWAVAATSFWFLVEIVRPGNVFVRPTYGILVAAVYFLYTLCVELVVPDTGLLSRHIQVWILLYFLLIYESRRRSAAGSMRFLFWVALLVLPVWLIATLQGYDEFGRNASRLATRSSEEARELSEQGIGGFGLVYSVVVAIPLLAFCTFFPRRVDWTVVSSRYAWMRAAAWWLVAANLALGVAVVINAGYSLALIVMSSSLLILFGVRKRGWQGIIRLLLLSATLAVGALLVAEPALDLAVDATRGTMYERKAEDLRATFRGEAPIGTVEDRAERYERSFRLFLEHPVTGTLTYDDVGKHSAYLDRFAQYGFLIGIAFVYLMVRVPLRIARNPAADFGLSLSVLFIAIAFPLVNNAFAAFGFMLFIFYPAGMSMLKGAGHSRASRVPEMNPNAIEWR